MLNNSIAIKLLEIAKRYKVHPTLLLISISALAKNEKTKEDDIIGPYFRKLSDEFKTIAENAILSKRSKSKEAGQLELSPIADLPTIAKYISNEDLERIKIIMPKGGLLRFLHCRAYNHVTADFSRMRLKWRKAKFKDGEPDAIQIIKLLCSDLVAEYRSASEMFKDFDVVMN